MAIKKVGAIVMLYQKDKALDNFINCEPLTDDVYESILEARREDAEYAERREDAEYAAKREDAEYTAKREDAEYTAIHADDMEPIL